MKNLFKKTLSQQEINNALAKIRLKYKEYIDKFMKPSGALNNFETRYINALNTRLDMAAFLSAEISVITELLDKEEKKLNSAGNDIHFPKPEDNKSIADKVLEENQKRIKKYREAKIDEGASSEIKRLIGVFQDFEKDQWPVIEALIRRTYSSYNITSHLQIENRLLEFCPGRNDTAPRNLNRYSSLLKEFPRRYSLLEKEEKAIILQAAFVLHDMVAEIDALCKIPQNENSVKELEKIQNFLHIVISDFRLKDLKPGR